VLIISAEVDLIYKVYTSARLTSGPAVRAPEDVECLVQARSALS
jgi:hypothetical protein